MDFKQIEAFVNVVRYKSFSKAADATFFTQPTISTHISTLEKELDSKLLDRCGRTVEMTPQGVKFYKYASDMVNIREQAIESFNRDSEDVEGILEIQTSSIPGINFIPKAISKFHKTHRMTQFYVELSDSQNVVDNILDRRGEIGFVGERNTNSLLEYVKIFSDRSVLIVPESYCIEGNEISIEEAISYPFVWRESGSATRKAFEEEAARCGYERSEINVVARINDLDAVSRTVAEGLGVSILSEHTVEMLSGEGIKVVNIKGFYEKRDFYLISLKGRALSPAAEVFKKFVISKCEDV